MTTANVVNVGSLRGVRLSGRQVLRQYGLYVKMQDTGPPCGDPDCSMLAVEARTYLASNLQSACDQFAGRGKGESQGVF